MNWTNSQINCVEELKTWIGMTPVTQDDYFRTLEGPAGSGKSTVTKEIISELSKYDVLGVAPTHTAKDILIEFARIRAVTAHQLLGLKPDISLEYYNPANPTYSPLSNDLFENNKIKLYVIDESSMLNKAIVNMMKERALEENKKLLFIGDRIQLPPVGELLSTAFSSVKTLSLTEIVRQAGSNPINEMISLAREDAQNNTNSYHTYIKQKASLNEKNLVVSEDGIEEGYIIANDVNTIKDKLYTLFSETRAEHDYKYIKILTFTNVKAKAYNKLIKSVINPSDLPVSVGDWLFGYTPIKNSKDIPVTQNGVYYKVTTATLDYLVYNTIHYKTVVINMKQFITDEEGNVKEKLICIRVLHPDSYEDFYPILKTAFEQGEKYRRWKTYYNLIRNFGVMDDFTKTKLDSRGNPKTVKMLSKNIDLGYAITVHKSQGCTFNNVFIDYSNFSKCFELSTRKRLTYVANSRAKSINMVYYKLEDNG